MVLTGLRRPLARGAQAWLALAAVVSAAAAVACGGVTAGHGGTPARSRHARAAPAAPAAPGSLSAISCIGSSGCMAVGGAFQGVAGDNGTRRIAEWWNGREWRLMKPPGSATAPLNAVSCTAAPGTPGPDCMVVGATALTAAGQAVAERWNGRAWQLLSPRSPGHQDILTGVSCAGPRFCMAVGIYTPHSGWRFLAQVWNGVTWRRVKIPTPAGNDLGQLNGVTCLRPAWCMASGGYDPGTGNGLAVTEIWNGARWRIASASGLPRATILQDAACSSASHCVAIGGADDGNHALAAQWNGTRWTVTGPPASQSGDSLASVACASASTCMVVGSRSSAGVALELTAGRSWRVPPAASAQTSYWGLSGISCPGPRDCLAVGYKQDGNDAPDFTLAERWDGRGWDLVAAP